MYVVVLPHKAQMDSIGPLFENAQSVSQHTSEMEVTSDKNDELEDFGTMTPTPHATYACSKISGKQGLLDDETHYSLFQLSQRAELHFSEQHDERERNTQQKLHCARVRRWETQ